MRFDLLPVDLEGKLYKVVEECGEVLQVIGKIGRHGLKPTDPKTKKKYDNLQDLKNEMEDLEHSMIRLRTELDLIG